MVESMVEGSYARVTTSLLDIRLKHLGDAATRLQRVLLKIQPYHFVIKYVPGKDIPMADALSRVSPNEKTEMKGLDVTIQELTHSYPGYKLSPSRRQHNKTKHFSYLFNRCWKVGLNLAENYQRS